MSNATARSSDSCAMCGEAITSSDRANEHHAVPRSAGGTDAPENLVTLHARCHRAHHSARGDFAVWGRRGGLRAAEAKAWTLTLKNVRTHPRYELARIGYHLFRQR